MAVPLADVSDLEDIFRPLADSEAATAMRLLAKASAMLRQLQPHIDRRIAQYATDPAATGALDPMLAAAVTAQIVKRFLDNPTGAMDSRQTVGGITQQATYRPRTATGDLKVYGELQVTTADLAMLKPYSPKTKVGSIRTKARLAARFSGWQQRYPQDIEILQDMGSGVQFFEVPIQLPPDVWSA